LELCDHAKYITNR